MNPIYASSNERKRIWIDEEISRLTAQRDDLVAALRAVRADGMLAAHGAHWDKQGTHGANCPACIANRKALDIIDAALAKAEQP